MLRRGMMAQAAGGGGGASYWNPADTDAKITLSGSGKNIATRSATSSGTWCSTRGVTSHNSGKWYAECTDTTDAASSMMFGIGTAAAALTNYPGQNGASFGVHANAVGGIRTYTSGASTNPGIASITTGGYARLAVDFAAGKLWLGVSSSATWAGGGDPAAGTSPTYTFTPGTTLFLMLGMFTSGQVCTLKSQVGENTGVIPTGFSMWG